MVQAFFSQITIVGLGICANLTHSCQFFILSPLPPSHEVQYSISMTLAAVSFKVVIILLLTHCLQLLPFGVFMLVPCFVVWFLACCFTLIALWLSGFYVSSSWCYELVCSQ